MKVLRGLATLALIASIAYAARELWSVRRVANAISAGAPPERLAAFAGEDSPLAKLLAAQTGALADAAPPAASAAPAPPPRPERVEATDTNSDPGRVVEGRGGAEKAVPGGGVIVDASGRRLEIAPTPRPAPSAAQRAAAVAKILPKLEPPGLDDPRLGLRERKTRAETVLIASALAAFALVFWARRFRS